MAKLQSIRNWIFGHYLKYRLIENRKDILFSETDLMITSCSEIARSENGKGKKTSNKSSGNFIIVNKKIYYFIQSQI